MSYEMLYNRLKLSCCAFSITRIKEIPQEESRQKLSCIAKIFSYVSEHGALVLTPETITCPGACVGCGFRDGIPAIPGGFGKFIAQGAGKGFPEGERIKCNEAIAEQMLCHQPQGVMDGFAAIRVAPYCESVPSELVTLLLNPDQFTAIVSLFYYRKASIDEVIVPIASGCAQIFRIPFGELGKPDPKAVMSNLDFVSRPFLSKELLGLTITGAAFAQMCSDVPDSFLVTNGWRPVQERL